MEKATINDYVRMCRKYFRPNCPSCPLRNEECNLGMMNDTELNKANEIILKWYEEPVSYTHLTLPTILLV